MTPQPGPQTKALPQCYFWGTNLWTILFQTGENWTKISGFSLLTGLFGVKFEYTWTLDLHCPYLGQVTSVTDKINRYRSKSVLGPLHLEFFGPINPNLKIKHGSMDQKSKVRIRARPKTNPDGNLIWSYECLLLYCSKWCRFYSLVTLWPSLTLYLRVH